MSSAMHKSGINLNLQHGKYPAATFLERTHYSAPYDHGYHEHVYEGGYGGGSSKKKKSNSVALTALTLLAFLYFLHILQQCLQEHMDEMNPQVIIMQARQRFREAEAKRRVGQVANTIYANLSSTEKEPRLKAPKTTPTIEKDEYYYEYSQIPVKLKIRDP